MALPREPVESRGIFIAYLRLVMMTARTIQVVAIR